LQDVISTSFSLAKELPPPELRLMVLAMDDTMLDTWLRTALSTPVKATVSPPASSSSYLASKASKVTCMRV
jgi:hypothetical protein